MSQTEPSPETHAESSERFKSSEVQRFRNSEFQEVSIVYVSRQTSNREEKTVAVYTVTKSYHTKGNMGMIDVTGDFQSAVEEACREKKIHSGIITGFTTGGVAALTTLEFEPGLVGHDVREAMQGQNLTLVECDTRNRERDIVFQVMGE